MSVKMKAIEPETPRSYPYLGISVDGDYVYVSEFVIVTLGCNIGWNTTPHTEKQITPLPPGTQITLTQE